MGKKSKKKGGTGSKSKAARKEKLQERREQQLEDQVQQQKSPYLVGDRVWFFKDRTRSFVGNPNTYRGIIKGIDDDDILDIIPIQSKLEGHDKSVKILMEDVFPDFMNMTLRFNVGDKVLCKMKDRWTPGIITHLWPIEEIQLQGLDQPEAPVDAVPCYKCSPEHYDQYVYVPSDEDACVLKHPTSFRFSAGDAVVFDTKMAKGIGGSAIALKRASPNWLKGTATGVDFVGMDFYGSYRCSFVYGGKQYSCYITKDVDEHIARHDADPRARLFEAIEQDASIEHLGYLATHFKIDVTSFIELIATKALTYASYQALAWLQHAWGLDVVQHIDRQGNNILHAIALSSYAVRFFEEAGRISLMETPPEWKLYFTDPDLLLPSALNNKGETWLQILVRRGNVRALDVALSPHTGFAWEIAWEYLLPQDKMDLIATSITNSGNVIMQCIYDSFASFRTLHWQCKCIENHPSNIANAEAVLLKNDSMSVFTGKDASHHAKQLARFFLEWENYHDSQLSTNPFKLVVKSGFSVLFKLLCDADDRLFLNERFWIDSMEDRGEYVQPELTPQVDEDTEFEELYVDLYTCCVIGNNGPSRSQDAPKYEKAYFFSCLKQHAVSCDPEDCPSWVSHLETMNYYYEKDDSKQFWKYRLRLLRDDEDLEGRLKILDHLLQTYQNASKKLLEDVLVALRHRQCGVLRFMVEKGLIGLNTNASSNRMLAKYSSKMEFLEKDRITSSMSTKDFLCFSAVEYDDLQSLQWLGESFGTPIKSYNGMNLLHFSAFMGRIEIIAWLYTRPEWTTLVGEVCRRKPFQNAFAVHIAASRGHLIAVELMLALNVSAEDEKGKIPQQYAKKSQHDFAREWAAKKEKPSALEKDIKKLLRLLNSSDTTTQQLKMFIMTSKCLDIETWRDCGYRQFDVKGPMGYSMGDVARECCCNWPDNDFVRWICKRLYFYPRKHEMNEFWGVVEAKHKFVKHDDLIKLVTLAGHNDLARYLQKSWLKNFHCVDVQTENFLLTSALGNHDGAHELLSEIRSEFLCVLACLEIAMCSDNAFHRVILRGGRRNELEEILHIEGFAKKFLDDEEYIDSESDPIDMSDISLTVNGPYKDGHTIAEMLAFTGRSRADLCQVHLILAIEGSLELVECCLQKVPGWTAEMELDIVRVSAFLGHAHIIDIFLSAKYRDINLLSSRKDQVREAILGAGESCRCTDLVHLIERQGAIHDPVKNDEVLPEDMEEDYTLREKRRQALMKKSLICVVLNSYLKKKICLDSQEEFRTLQFLLDKLGYTHKETLDALKLLLANEYSIKWIRAIVDLHRKIMQVLKLQPLMYYGPMKALCAAIVKACEPKIGWRGDKKEQKKDETVILRWLKKMSDMGIDIQDAVPKKRHHDSGFFIETYCKLQKQQTNGWSKFDIVKRGCSLDEIQSKIDQGTLSIDARYRGGLLLTHLSCAYDRVEVLEWLVETKGMDLNAKDGKRRTVLDVARAAKAPTTTRFIVERQAKRTIALFVQRNHWRLIALRKYQQQTKAAVSIQAHFRGHLVRKLHSGALLYRLEESQRFAAVWGNLIHRDFQQQPSSWSAIREGVSNIKHSGIEYDESYFNDTDEHLSRALEGALQVGGDEIGNESKNEEFSHVAGVEEQPLNLIEDISSNNLWLNFQMTSHVVKFLKQGDKKYKSFFVRRMQQLAKGERSRILKKRLKGSETTIYESYLEQKSGFRILWTEEGDTIIIWFVAKHKEVSRLMSLIDDSKSRTKRQQLPDSVITQLRNDDLLTNRPKGVLLDTFGNVPLKLYDVKLHSIDDITMDSWSPSLHLTDEEQEVVEAKGTVLVLGRSGTGKTVCICNRMEYDRQKYGQDSSFTQLFVARSKRLCRYVSETVGRTEKSTFQTFEELLYDIDTALPNLTGSDDHFFPSQRVDFQRFKQEFYNPKSSKEKEVSALIVWMVIRTFIKGSIEAFQSPNGILSRNSFINVETLGKNRCRVPAELRDHIYNEAMNYEQNRAKLGLWDDSDRIRHLLSRLDQCKTSDPDALGKVLQSKVYVDEIQDYTQIECLLFFYLGGPGGLFLCGDSAQSVVEGTEFRFEEIRSVGYFIAGQGNDRRSLVPQKPKTVNVNFRSHAGILNTAAAILDLLFTYFPSSVKQLKKDHGLFQGSRPSVLHKVSTHQLTTLVSDKLKGAVILVHDESAYYWRQTLDYKLVYGIREAKGLEFKSVILLNFFQELPSSLQRPWRNLLLNREGSDFELNHPLVGTQLKLLYTGITRCIERLFFVETLGSIAGDTAVRWLTTSTVSKKNGRGGTKRDQSLATRNNCADIEAMAMTSDEFLVEGFNNAEMAETAEMDLSIAALDRAIWCFEQADNLELAAKARAHRLSIQFRLDISHQSGASSDGDAALIEMKGAQLMEALTMESLLLEVTNVYYSISRFLSSYAKDELERQFITKIRMAIIE